MTKWVIGLVVVCAIGMSPAWSAPLSPDLKDRLQHGGYVLLMRHASSPAQPPDKNITDPEKIALERQLDQKGRTMSEAMGRGFKAMHIPVGKIFSSPTYRARETVRLAGFGSPQTVPELGDQGHSMARLIGPGPLAWLKSHVAEKPAARKNTVIVTQMPNIADAFPNQAKDLKDGETLVFMPDGKGHAEMVGKIPTEDWWAQCSEFRYINERRLALVRFS